MQLEGSCHCGEVRFSVESETPYPYMLCYCTICRKTEGVVASNVLGDRKTLRVRGRKHLRLYRAWLREPGRRAKRSLGERWFCGLCGTHLYVLDDRWPDGVWPNAAAIDTELPKPPENVHIMVDTKPGWVPTPGRGPKYPGYPPLSIVAWHEVKGLGPRPPRPPRRRKRRRRASGGDAVRSREP